MAGIMTSLSKLSTEELYARAEALAKQALLYYERVQSIDDEDEEEMDLARGYLLIAEILRYEAKKVTEALKKKVLFTDGLIQRF